MKRIKKIICIIIGLLLLLGIIALGINLWVEYGIEKSNPQSYETIGDIPTPEGFKRINGDDADYGNFLRSLPLKPKGSVIKYYWGGIADLQELNYAVVDLPLLSNAEQCADVCMRLRAEYLYQAGQAKDIHFMDVQGNLLKYNGEESRESFEKYLRHVFDVANTYSLRKEMEKRDLGCIQPGDIFVYPANSSQYGHAVMVADVAENTNGYLAVLLVEGYLPARSIHVMRNWQDEKNSPWFILDGESDEITFSAFRFSVDDLRNFPQ